MVIIFSGIGGVIIAIIFTVCINRRKKDDDTFEQITEIFLEHDNYRKGVVHKDETEMISKIYHLSLKFRTKKYDDILPEIKDFGKRYKASIPPAGAKSAVAEKHKKFLREAEALKNKTEARMSKQRKLKKGE